MSDDIAKTADELAQQIADADDSTIEYQKQNIFVYVEGVKDYEVYLIGRLLTHMKLRFLFRTATPEFKVNLDDADSAEE